jgi:hypothetical protein
LGETLNVWKAVRRCRERIHHQQGKRMNCFCTCNRSAPG